MIRVRALGQNVIEIKRRTIRPDAELVFATLLYLTVERGRRVERETIAGLFWPRETAARRRHSLRQILYKLRQLGVDTGDAADALTIPASEVWLDFEDADASEDRKVQRELAAPGGVRCLPGYAPKMSKAFMEWLEEFRARAEGSARRRLVAAIAHARRLGRWEEVEPLARNCLQLDPLNEEATLALAEAIALAGAKSKAVAMLDAYVAELGPNATDMKLPATVLRRRIADQLGPRRLKGPLETKLIGREDIMEVLTAALEKTKAGHAATHVVWGVSGIGKTRVLEEVTKLAALMGATTVTQRAAPDDEHTPGLTMVRLVRAMLAAPGALGLAPEVLGLLQRLTAQTPNESVGTEIDVSDDALVHALVDLERALAWERPVVVVLDDFHHADAASKRVLSRAQGCLVGERAMLLMASVTEPPSTGLGHISSHCVKRLQPDACLRLAGALIDKAGLERDKTVIDSIASASGGHPFILREAVIAFVQRSGGSPMSSLDQVLQQRLARVTEEARDVLLSTLILGEHASMAVLFECAGFQPPAVERAIVELEQEQILQFGDGRVSAHGLWRSSLNVLFPAGQIGARQLRVAQQLEILAREQRDAELLVASGLQFQRGGDVERASRVFARGGTRLHERGMTTGAFETLRRAATIAPLSQDFDCRLFEALQAASEGQLLDDTLAMLEKFGDRLRKSGRLSPSQEAELEVIDVETKKAVLDPYPNLVVQCLAVARRPELSDNQRLRVGLVGAMAAEQLRQPAVVDIFADLANSIDQATPGFHPIADQIAMVHAVSTRRLADARSIANRQIEASRDMDVNARCRTLLRARVPFLFDCDFDRVGEIVATARETIRLYPSSYHALRADDAYGTLCIERMHLTEASEVLERTLDAALAFGYGGIAGECSESVHRLRVARGQSPDTVITPIPSQAGAAQQHGRVGVFQLCNSAVTLARCGASDELQTVADALAVEWKRLTAGCPLDYPCFALGAALTALGRRSDAVRLMSDYRKSIRVARNPPSPMLIAVGREFGIWTD